MKAAFHIGFAFVYLFVPGDLVAQQHVLQLNDSLGRPAAISFEEMTGYAGVTVCWKGRAFPFVRMDLSAIEEAATRAHEAKHVEQAARFTSCEAFNDWYGTPVGQLDAEAEAYAAGLCRAIALGYDPVSGRRSVLDLLERKFGAANRLMAVQWLERYAKHCGLGAYLK